jgi:hypothetical protein
MSDAKISTLHELKASKSETPDAEAVDLLDGLPLGESGLLNAPEDLLRHLFDALRLEVRFNNATNQALCRVVIDEGSADRLPNASRDQRSTRRAVSCTDVLRAPGGAEPKGRIPVLLLLHTFIVE